MPLPRHLTKYETILVYPEPLVSLMEADDAFQIVCMLAIFLG